MEEQVRGPWGDLVKVVAKPWGKEEWAAYDNGRYAGKILTIEEGRRLSLQYHRVKHETLLVLEGRLEFTLQAGPEGWETHTLEPGELVVVRPGVVHRMQAVGGPVRIVEFSSPELDDVVRLSDDYDRAGDRA